MCHYVTLIVPCEDTSAVGAVMARHGRAASPIDNPSIRKVLSEGERQYLTTTGHCDCGTVLASRYDTPEALEAALARESVRLKRKGWSQAKIARSLHDRRAAEARPRGQGGDSLELWAAALRDLRGSLKLPHVGLFVRLYRGAISSEVFSASRREAPRGEMLLEALKTIAQDEVTVFRFGGN